MSENVRELLAAYAHESWSGWMKYLFGKSIDLSSGAVVIPGKLVKRWKRQIGTPYAELPEGEKESDRKEADRMLAILDPTSLRSENEKMREENTALRERVKKVEALNLELVKCVPTSWLDPILSGPDKVADPPYGCPEVENILNAIRKRMNDHISHFTEKEPQ